LHRRLDQLFGPVARRGIEEQGISGLEDITSVGVPITNLPGKHVNELDAGMTEINIRRRIGFERHEIGLGADDTAQRMSEEIVEMAEFCTMAIDPNALSRLDE
jgi:hypothetical protein